MENVFITAAVRTPTGKLLGKLSSFSAPALSTFVIKELLRRSRIEKSLIDEVIMGNVICAGIGQNPARQSAILSGLPDSTAAFTVNKVCASGLKAVALAAQAIKLGDADIIIAGGMESMSNAPHLLRDLRKGKRYGDCIAVDSMIYDGLWDCYYNAHMGALCEDTAERYNISREKQDFYALQSHLRAIAATDSGVFSEEIAPVKKGDLVILDHDETIRRDTDLKKLAALKPAFKPTGTVTAGNSPGLNDGAAALILMSEKKARELNITPLAEIIGYAPAHTDPKWYTIAPVKSVQAVLKKTGLRLDDFDLIEENEAFAAQTLAVARELDIDIAKLNVHGGAIALGHPIGASGARLLVTLINALRNRKKKLGLATLCLGGGGAYTMAIRAL